MPANVETKSKLGLILVERKLSQMAFIKLIEEKTGVSYSKSNMHKYVNKKCKFISSETLKLLAFTLQVSIDDIVDDWVPPKKKK